MRVCAPVPCGEVGCTASYMRRSLPCPTPGRSGSRTAVWAERGCAERTWARFVHGRRSLSGCLPHTPPPASPTPRRSGSRTRVWLNVVALSSHGRVPGRLRRALARSDAAWRAWYDAEAPERAPVPAYEERLSKYERMCIVRVRPLRDSVLDMYPIQLWVLCRCKDRDACSYWRCCWCML